MKEKKGFRKKHVVLAAMVLVLGAAVYLNYFVASNTPLTVSTGEAENDATVTTTTQPLGESVFVAGTTAPSQEESYFDAARRNRASARQEALDILKDTLQNVKTDEATQQEAIAAAATVAAAVEQEDAIESLLKAKGFEDCVVYIENGNAYVAVKAASLEQAQTLQILQVVTSQSAVKADAVSIKAVE